LQAHQNAAVVGALVAVVHPYIEPLAWQQATDGTLNCVIVCKITA
jgi:hypothetical protein